MTNDQSTTPAATPATGAFANDGYEFNADQETVIRELAGSMGFVGTASAVLAVIMWIIGIATMFMMNPAGLGNIIQGVLLIFIGIWTRSAARSFQLVVDTKGSDITNMMNALGELRRLYNLQKWLMILGLVLVIGAFVLGIVAGIFIAARAHH